MATNVTVERIELTAIDKFSGVIGQAQTGFKNLGSTIDAVKGALSAVGVVLGAREMVNLYHDVLKATSALDDMAEMTGASVENLSKLQVVAKVGGHDFDSLTGQIGKMIKGLKSADEDGQKAAHALNFLDIKAKDANGRFRDTAEILVDVAKALSRYEDGGNKVALIQDILGKGAERYLPLLKDMVQEGEVQARVTARQAEEAEKFEKNLNRLKISFEDGRRAMMLEFLPALNDIAAALVRANKEGGLFLTWVQGLRELGSRGLAGPGGYIFSKLMEEYDAERVRYGAAKGGARYWAKDVVDPLDIQTVPARALNYNTPKKATGTDAGLNTAESFVRRLQGMVADRQSNSFLGEFERLDAELGKILLKYPQLRAEAAGLIDTLRGMKVAEEQAKSYAETWDVVQKRVEAAGEAFTKFFMENSRARKDMEFQLQMVGKLPHEQQLASQLRDIQLRREAAIGGIDPSASNRAQTIGQIEAEAERASAAVRKLHGDLRAASRDAQTGFDMGIRKYLDEIGDAAAQMEGLVTNTFKSMEDALVRFVVTGKLDFKSFADSVIADIARIYIRQSLTEPIAKGLSGAGGLGGWVQGLFNRGGGGVDEAGWSSPLPKGGQMSASSGGKGGGDVHVHLNMATGVAGTVRSEMMAMLPKITEHVAGAVAVGREREGRG